MNTLSYRSTIAGILCLWYSLPIQANNHLPGSALQYQQTTNTRIVVEDNFLRFFTGNLERMTIDGSGNIGIGDINTEGAMDIVGKSQVDLGWGSSTSLSLRGNGEVSGKDWTSIRFHGKDGDGIIRLAESEQNRGLQFGVNDVKGENLVVGLSITGNGNIGIGTADPGTLLQIGQKSTYGTAANKLGVVGDKVSGFTSFGNLRDVNNYDVASFGRREAGHQVSAIKLLAFTSSTKGARIALVTSDVSGYSNETLKFMVGGGTGTDVMNLLSNGNVGIGTTSPSYKLHVSGQVKGTAFISTTTTYADFVFDDDYKLPALAEVEKFIEKNNHLPEIPSEEEARANGVNLQEMQAKLLQKIEELTLYVIELKKENESQQQEIEKLKQPE